MSSGQTDSLDFVMLTLNADHAQYVLDGALTRNPENADELTIGRTVMVFDRSGWATLHVVNLVRREGPDRVIGFDGRIPWPDGAIAARKVPDA